MDVLAILFWQFSRTVAPQSDSSPALIRVMAHFVWKSVTILTSSEAVWFESGLRITQRLEAGGRMKVRTSNFKDEAGSKKAQLREIKHSGYRIVILLAYTADILAIASLAEQDGMSAGYAWLLVEGSSTVSKAQLGWLYLTNFFQVDKRREFHSRVKDYDTMVRFNLSVDAKAPVDEFAAPLYDAIELYARAATKVLSDGGDVVDGTAVTAALRNTSFVGVEGVAVDIDGHGDRLGSYIAMSYVRGADGEVASVRVGVFNHTLQQYSAIINDLVWPGESLDVPDDYAEGDRARPILCL